MKKLFLELAESGWPFVIKLAGLEVSIVEAINTAPADIGGWEIGSALGMAGLDGTGWLAETNVEGAEHTGWTKTIFVNKITDKKLNAFC